jgi:hypothetical protein
MQEFFKNYWPLPGDSEIKISNKLQERIEKIKSKHARRD